MNGFYTTKIVKTYVNTENTAFWMNTRQTTIGLRLARSYIV